MFSERELVHRLPLLARQLADPDGELASALPFALRGHECADGAAVQLVRSWRRRRFGTPDSFTARVIVTADVRVVTASLEAGTVLRLTELRSDGATLLGSASTAHTIRVPEFGAACAHGTAVARAPWARVRLTAFDAGADAWVGEARGPWLGLPCCCTLAEGLSKRL